MASAAEGFYQPSATMKEARDEYFRVNGFGETGGYEDAWVDFKLGPLPCPFPNTKSRIKAVKVHDLHHILTGYRTDVTGEFEISAWELGAGCKGFAAAWYLNLAGMTTGLLVAPRRVFRAFVRGRRADSLYGRDLEQMLGQTVAQMRAATNVDEGVPSATAGDIARFLGFVAIGAPVAWVSFALAIFIAPVGILAGLLRRNAVKSAGSASSSAA